MICCLCYYNATRNKIARHFGPDCSTRPLSGNFFLRLSFYNLETTVTSQSPMSFSCSAAPNCLRLCIFVSVIFSQCYSFCSPAPKNKLKLIFHLGNFQVQILCDAYTTQSVKFLESEQRDVYCMCKERRFRYFLWRLNTVLDSLLFPVDSHGYKNVCALTNGGVATSYNTESVGRWQASYCVDAIVHPTVTKVLDFF